MYSSTVRVSDPSLQVTTLFVLTGGTSFDEFDAGGVDLNEVLGVEVVFLGVDDSGVDVADDSFLSSVSFCGSGVGVVSEGAGVGVAVAVGVGVGVGVVLPSPASVPNTDIAGAITIVKHKKTAKTLFFITLNPFQNKQRFVSHLLPNIIQQMTKILNFSSL